MFVSAVAQLTKLDIPSFNGSITLYWSVVAGANACGMGVSYSVYLSQNASNLPLTYNTTDT